LVRDKYLYEDYRGVDWNVVRDEFAPRVTAAANTEAFYGLMREMIDRLGDEHSRFESPQEVAEEQARFEGDLSYGGIGAIVRTIDEGGLVITLARDGPAEEAGIRPRDMILAIGGVPFTNTAAFGPDGPIGAVRGAPGTPVILTVRSPGGLPRNVTVVRRAIPGDAFPDVETQRIPEAQVGLIRIDTFYAEDLDKLVRADLEQLLAEGPLEGLIIDVRTNSGGFVYLMRNILGLFIDGGSIGSTGGRASNVEQTIPSGQTIPELNGIPIVVLTSSETVSAAEMFAAGMQVLERARIVGMPTAGNTENLTPHELSDGSRLWLAELAYRLPDGSLIEGRGVIPDREVDVQWWQFEPAQDPQIQAAIGELRNDFALQRDTATR
jgi:C-terminal peptidase prc